MDRRRAAAAGLVCLLAGALGWALFGRRPSIPTAGASRASGDPSAAAGETAARPPGLVVAAEAVPPAAPSPATSSRRVEVVAMVAREGHRPVAGARVEFAAAGAEALAVSGSDGRIRFSVSLGGPDVAAILVARAPGLAAVVQNRWWLPPRGSALDVGLLELRPTRQQSVVVRGAEGGVVGALVRASVGSDTGTAVLAEGRTDVAGSISLADLPRGALRIVARTDGRSAVAWTEVGHTGPLTLDLRDDVAVDLLVVDDDGGTPVVGARVEARAPATVVGEIGAPCDPPVAPVVTDAQGRARIAGLVAGDDHVAWVTAEGRSPAEAELPDRPSEVIRIPLQRLRRVSFPLEAGDAPVPGDGSRIRLEGGSARSPSPEAGHVEGGWLRVEGWPSGLFVVRAIASDGSVANLETDAAAIGGSAQFYRPRSVTVRARDESGRGVSGLRTRLGGAYTDATLTDAEGVARFSGLLPTSYPVLVQGMEVGHVNVEQADESLEVLLDEERTFALRFLEDGTPTLPLGLEWWVDGPLVLDARTDPETRTVHVRARQRLPNSAIQVSASAEGFARTAAAGEWAGPSQATRIDVPLERLGSLIVEIRARPDQIIQVGRILERTDVGASLEGAGFLLTKAGRHVVRDAAPGRWRLHDMYWGLSGPRVVLSSGGTATASIDLTHAVERGGRIVVPTGHDVRFAELRTADGRRWEVDAEGRFRLRTPNEGRFQVGIRHPVLGETEAAWEPGGDAAAEWTIQVPERAHGRVRVLSPYTTTTADWGLAIRVRLADESDEDWSPLPRTTYVDGIVRFALPPPGTYEFVLDVDGLAPKRIPGVVVRSDGLDLGVVPLDEGSSLRVRFLLPVGGRTPSLRGTVDGPLWTVRSLEGDGPEFLVRGLPAGETTVDLEWEAANGRWKPFQRTLVLDGRSTVDVEVDTR